MDPDDPDAYAGVIGVDGFPGQDNPHLGASLWLAAQYARSGRTDSARKLVDSVLSRANDLGLLSTEWSPEQRRMTGNFPQTFTHLALVQALDALDAGEVAALQVRLKDAPDDAIRRAVDALRPVAEARDVAVLLNDRPGLAVACGCDGAHLGQGDGDHRAQVDQVADGEVAELGLKPTEAASPGRRSRRRR